MRVIVLIGFCYDISDLQPLPGILIDLFKVYSHCKKNVGWDKIIVITDIYKKSTPLFVTAVFEGIVSVNITTFLEEIKDFHLLYINEHEMFKEIRKVVTNADQVLAYYSGHSKHNFILFPQINYNATFGDYEIKNYVTIESFRDLFINYSKYNSQILFIMDCCNGVGLKLPFQLVKGVAGGRGGGSGEGRGSSGEGRVKSFDNLYYYRLTDFPQHKYTRNNILCLSSSMHDERAVASRSGSIFTRILFSDVLNEKNNLSDILKHFSGENGENSNKEIKDSGKERIHNQTTTIHASHPNLKDFFPWFLGKKLLVRFDDHFNLIRILR